MKISTLSLLAALLIACTGQTSLKITNPDEPSTASRNLNYRANRFPLKPYPLLRLPAGSIQPEGWLKTSLQQAVLQLKTQAVKATGAFLTNWLSGKKQAQKARQAFRYELKATVLLALATQNQDLLQHTQRWMQQMLASQAEDGLFGTQAQDVATQSTLLSLLLHYYDLNPEQEDSIEDFCVKYFHYMASQPDEEFVTQSENRSAVADLLYVLDWTFNKTKEQFLMDLAKRLRTWVNQQAITPMVLQAQAFRAPAQFGLHTHGQEQTQASYNWFTAITKNPNLPTDAQKLALFQFEQFQSNMHLLYLTGNVMWANLNEGFVYRKHAWAQLDNGVDVKDLVSGVFVQNLWAASPDNGAVVQLYAPATVTMRVADGNEIQITSQVRYPEKPLIEFALKTPKDIRFPLYLRIPSWVNLVNLKINELTKQLTVNPSSFLRIDRRWQDGDAISVEMHHVQQ